METENRYDVIIIGAGYSGLGAGIAAKRKGLTSLILEADSEPGGLCRTTSVAGCDFDMGPKIILIDDAEEGADLLSYFGGKYDRLPMIEQTFMKRFGLMGFPVQRHLHDLPTDVRSKIVDEIKSLKPNTSPTSYEEWLRSLYGDTLSSMVLVPYEEKKWQTSLKRMDYHWALSRPVRVDYNEILQGANEHLGPNRWYYYPSKGNIATLSNALAADAGNITYNSRVTDISLQEKYVVAGGKAILLSKPSINYAIRRGTSNTPEIRICLRRRRSYQKELACNQSL